MTAVSFSALLFQAVSDVGLWITKIRKPLSLTQSKGITLRIEKYQEPKRGIIDHLGIENQS